VPPMRRSAPVARISASTCGRTRFSASGAGAGREVGRKILALVGVEDREAFEEGDGFRLLGGARAFPVRTEAVGIDDGGAFLALAHMGAELQRLAESEPALAGETALGDGAPEDEDVDAAVGAAGRGIARQAERGADAGPRLHPGHAPLFELGDDLVGDLLVEVRSVREGFVGWRRVGHGVSPRRASESLSLACCTRHRPRTALSLSLSGDAALSVSLRPCLAEAFAIDLRKWNPIRMRESAFSVAAWEKLS
jgi:hypothetical protein